MFISKKITLIIYLLIFFGLSINGMPIVTAMQSAPVATDEKAATESKNEILRFFTEKIQLNEKLHKQLAEVEMAAAYNTAWGTYTANAAIYSANEASFYAAWCKYAADYYADAARYNAELYEGAQIKASAAKAQVRKTKNKADRAIAEAAAARADADVARTEAKALKIEMALAKAKAEETISTANSKAEKATTALERRLMAEADAESKTYNTPLNREYLRTKAAEDIEAKEARKTAKKERLKAQKAEALEAAKKESGETITMAQADTESKEFGDYLKSIAPKAPELGQPMTFDHEETGAKKEIAKEQTKPKKHKKKSGAAKSDSFIDPELEALDEARALYASTSESPKVVTVTPAKRSKNRLAELKRENELKRISSRSESLAMQPSNPYVSSDLMLKKTLSYALTNLRIEISAMTVFLYETRTNEEHKERAISLIFILEKTFNKAANTISKDIGKTEHEKIEFEEQVLASLKTIQLIQNAFKALVTEPCDVESYELAYNELSHQIPELREASQQDKEVIVKNCLTTELNILRIRQQDLLFPIQETFPNLKSMLDDLAKQLAEMKKKISTNEISLDEVLNNYEWITATLNQINFEIMRALTRLS